MKDMIEHIRFSDMQLQEFFELYKETDNRLTQHIEEGKKRQNEYNIMLNEILKKLELVEESTKGVATLYKEGRIGGIWIIRIGKVILWVAALYGAFKATVGGLKL